MQYVEASRNAGSKMAISPIAKRYQSDLWHGFWSGHLEEKFRRAGRGEEISHIQFEVRELWYGNFADEAEFLARARVVVAQVRAFDPGFYALDYFPRDWK